MEQVFPTIDNPIDPPYKVVLLLDILQEEGIAAAAVLAGSGLDLQQVSNPATRISVRQLLTVFGNAQRLSSDPALALRAGKRVHITHFGLYGYALLSSATPRDAIEFALRYRPLTAPLIGLAFDESNGQAGWIFSDILGLGTNSELFRFALEFQLGAQLSLHGDILGAAAQPCAIHLVYPAPIHAASYLTLLGCPARFEQARNELRFDGDWLQHKLTYANPITAALVRETCDQLLAELRSASGLASQVFSMLMQGPGHFPDIENIAERLHLTARTLRRKLQTQGVSYQTILTDVRRQLAIGYLRKTHMNIEDIAA
ncbi:MAG: AraC family transcriptional regulator ligand-binding domain-containing protein, partial [Herbaspirillum sp.]